MNTSLKRNSVIQFIIEKDDFDLYYSGFSNKTLWPLFHYFMQFVDYDESFYKAYVKVNQIFAKNILSHVQKGDKIWIHDYHLLLLPQLIRKEFPDVSAERSIELKEELSSLIANLNLEILEGNKVLEVKSISFNKGKAAKKYLSGKDYEFIMAIGDDFSDEYLYQQLPENSISIKAGINKTLATYNLESFKEVRNLLKILSTTPLKSKIKNEVVVEF